MFVYKPILQMILVIIFNYTLSVTLLIDPLISTGRTFFLNFSNKR